MGDLEPGKWDYEQLLSLFSFSGKRISNIFKVVIFRASLIKINGFSLSVTSPLFTIIGYSLRWIWTELDKLYFSTILMIRKENSLWLKQSSISHAQIEICNVFSPLKNTQKHASYITRDKLN